MYHKIFEVGGKEEFIFKLVEATLFPISIDGWSLVPLCTHDIPQ